MITQIPGLAANRTTAASAFGSHFMRARSRGIHSAADTHHTHFGSSSGNAMPLMTSGLSSRAEPNGSSSASRHQIDAARPAEAGRRAASTPSRAHAVCSMFASSEAVPALRTFARDTARRWGIAEEGVYTLRVAVSELVTNAVLHSGSADVEVAMRLRGTTAIIQVKDSGTWMPPTPSAEVRHEADEIHGRGLNIVRAYATRCTVESSARGTQVCAEIDVSAPAPRFFEFDAELESIGTL